jgi:hypothetical protein
MAFCRALCLIGGGPVGLDDFDFRFAAALARRCWQGRDIATAVFGLELVGGKVDEFLLVCSTSDFQTLGPTTPDSRFGIPAWRTLDLYATITHVSKTHALLTT